MNNNVSEMETETIYSRYMKPALGYVMQVGEAMALAVFFHIAADRTDSLVIDVFSFLITCSVGAYLAYPLGLLGQQLNQIKTKDWRVALGIALPIAVLMAFVAQHIGTEISKAVNEVALLSSRQ